MRSLSKYISFGSHQSQTTEHIKALYDMYRCILIIFLEKRGLKLTKKYFEFLFIPLSFFYS